jgi:hypothetical protein
VLKPQRKSSVTVRNTGIVRLKKLNVRSQENQEIKIASQIKMEKPPYILPF